jgi:hypothetical protein
MSTSPLATSLSSNTTTIIPFSNSIYSVLCNKPLHKNFIGICNKIYFDLPHWFTTWSRKKYIKVYGCSFAYMESENKNPIQSQKYANQFITVHSNITRDNSEHLPSTYEDRERPAQNESEASEGFMMIVNNYYTPKIYDLTYFDEKSINIWFKDAYGQIIPVRTPYSTDHGTWDEIYQAIFNIECEIAISE